MLSPLLAAFSLVFEEYLMRAIDLYVAYSYDAVVTSVGDVYSYITCFNWCDFDVVYWVGVSHMRSYRCPCLAVQTCFYCLVACVQFRFQTASLGMSYHVTSNLEGLLEVHLYPCCIGGSL